MSSATEFDYQSFGGNLSFAKKTKDKNGEFTAKLLAFLDQVKLIDLIELRTSNAYGRQEYVCRFVELFSNSQ